MIDLERKLETALAEIGAQKKKSLTDRLERRS
jgi:hypothetical protein